jgi:hypothetical protein
MADEAVETVRRFQVQEFRGIFPDFSEEEATFYLHSAKWSVEDAVTLAVTHISEGRRPPVQSVSATSSAGAVAGARHRQDPTLSQQPRGAVGGRARSTAAATTAAARAGAASKDDEADAVRRTEWELRKAMHIEQVHEATGLPRFECQEVLKGVDWNVNAAVAKIMPETLCVLVLHRIGRPFSLLPDLSASSQLQN